MITAYYVREEEKKHSVRFIETDAKGVPLQPSSQSLGTIYVKRSTGLADEKRLVVTINKA